MDWLPTHGHVHHVCQQLGYLYTRGGGWVKGEIFKIKFMSVLTDRFYKYVFLSFCLWKYVNKYVLINRIFGELSVSSETEFITSTFANNTLPDDM